MGCWYSRLIDREEMVSRCKARKRYMRQFVKARHSFSAAHSMYLRSLRNTGSALLQFATVETKLHHRITPVAPPQLPQTPPPPLSPISWTTTSTETTSSIRPPPPPPPPVPTSSTWDFWDPFMPTSGRSVDEEEWEETTMASSVAATTTVEAASVAQPPSMVTVTTATATATTSSSELAVVVSTKSKDLVEIIHELCEYFVKAANSGGQLSILLEVPTCTINRQGSSGKDYGHGKSFTPLLWKSGSNCSSARWNAFGKFCEDPVTNNVTRAGANATHSSTAERLYAWEKKLYLDVKNAEYLKIEHEKKSSFLRKLEMKSADYFKTEKAKKEAEKLESQMTVSLQAIETTAVEITKLRESELYPQLLDLVKGLMGMWRSMYEFHHVQTHIVQQLKYLNSIPSTNPTSEIHRQSTLQLELEAQQWHISFCNLIKSQRDYIQSLTGWLRLSLFQIGNNPFHKTRQDSAIYSLCEEWQLAINNSPDKVASEGIKSFLTMIHAIVVQQAEEQKQKRRSESAFKDLEKKVGELRSLESKRGPYSNGLDTGKDPVREKRDKVDAVRRKAEDEKAKYEKAVSVTRATTMNNLQMGLPNVFQAMTGFANVCTEAFESVQNQAKSMNDLHNVKMILP